MTIASDLIDDARSYSSAVLGFANGEVATAMQVATQLGAPTGRDPDVLPQINIVAPLPKDPGAPPEYKGSHFVAPDAPEAPQDLQNADFLYLGDQPGSAPQVLTSLFLPQRPTPNYDDTLLQGVPSVADIGTVPVAPDLLGQIATIVPPTLTDVVIGDAPAYQPPEFLGTEPVLPSAPPTDLDKVQRTQYATILPVMREAIDAKLDDYLTKINPNYHTAMQAIEDRLTVYLQGGTALRPDIEDAIYRRTLDKTNAEARRMRDKVKGEAARSGFTMPPITILQQLQDVDQERRNNNARAATEIAVKQAELEQQNLQFAVTQSANLRSIVLNAALAYYSGLVQVNGQAIEYARDVVDAIVKVYDLAVKYTDVQARVFEAQAAVYRAKLDGAMALIQAYEAQVRAEQAKVQVDLAKVQAYTARIEAVQAEANVYRSQVEAVVAKAQIERTKVDLYQARVQAYGAQINAYTAQWQGYSAAVSGEVAKVQASAEAVKAYGIQVDAFKAIVQARATAIDSVIRSNEMKIHEYAANIEAYKAIVGARAETVKAEIESFDSTLHGYVARANAISENARAQIAAFEATQRGLIAEVDVLLRKITEENRLKIERVEAVAKIATAGADINGRIAQAALSGMNTLAAEVVNEFPSV